MQFSHIWLHGPETSLRTSVFDVDNNCALTHVHIYICSYNMSICARVYDPYNYAAAVNLYIIVVIIILFILLY